MLIKFNNWRTYTENMIHTLTLFLHYYNISTPDQMGAAYRKFKSEHRVLPFDSALSSPQQTLTESPLFQVWTDPCVNLLLHSSLVCEQDPLYLNSFTLGSTSYHAQKDYSSLCLRYNNADSYPCKFTLGYEPLQCKQKITA